jgi:hypothetical protein
MTLSIGSSERRRRFDEHEPGTSTTSPGAFRVRNCCSAVERQRHEGGGAATKTR